MTCPAHGWTLPCLTCAHREHLADQRAGRVWLLGAVGTERGTQKPITLRTKRRQLALIRTPHGFVQSVDPETRQATGQPREFLVESDEVDATDEPRVIDVNYVDFR